MAKQLNVWLLGSQIGTLSQVDGRLGFAYSAQWLEQAGAGNGVATGGAPFPALQPALRNRCRCGLSPLTTEPPDHFLPACCPKATSAV